MLFALDWFRRTEFSSINSATWMRCLSSIIPNYGKCPARLLAHPALLFGIFKTTVYILYSRCYGSIYCCSITRTIRCKYLNMKHIMLSFIYFVLVLYILIILRHCAELFNLRYNNIQVSEERPKVVTDAKIQRFTQPCIVRKLCNTEEVLKWKFYFVFLYSRLWRFAQNLLPFLKYTASASLGIVFRKLAFKCWSQWFK